MSERRRVGLLFGGRSVEHEVSVSSARGVAAAFRDTPFECVPIAVTSEGRWLRPEDSRRVLAGNARRVMPGDASDDGGRVLIDPGGDGLVSWSPGRQPESMALDVLFPLIHGWGGEDGRLQGALELAGVPYVGSGVMASANGMDKATSRKLFEANEIPVCPWLSCTRADYDRDREGFHRRIGAGLGMPVFVKPCNGGSSVGISRVDRNEGLPAALELAFTHDREVVVERGLDAREIECAVLGNDDPDASVLGEIVPGGAFYDYASKYEDDSSELLIPAPLDDASSDRVRALALAAYRALRLRGLARVDFLVERDGGACWLNEVNTLPGFTPISMFPKLWQASGLGYSGLLERLVALALEGRERGVPEK